MVSMYEKYKDQGFEIISISLDRAADKEKLKAFITDNKMPWPQHFDGKGWKSDQPENTESRSCPLLS